MRRSNLMAGNVRYRGAASGVSFAGLRRFFGWWWRELYVLLPAGLRPYPRSAANCLWVEFRPETAIVRCLSSNRLEELGRVDLTLAEPAGRKLAFLALLGRLGRRRRWPVGISLPAVQVLRKTIELPLAARDNLRQVVGFELPRHTPFASEQAWYDCKESCVDLGQGRMTLQLLATARRPVESGVSTLREWGTVPFAVVPEDELTAHPRYANLLPPALRAGSSWMVRVGYTAMAGITVLMVVAALAVPLWQKREVAIELNRQSLSAREAANAIDGLRTELQTVTAEYQFPLEQKYRHPPAIAVIEDVTRLLPDDAWLTQLEIKAGEVVMSGEARSTNNLVRLAEGSKFLVDASFRSPLVKGRNNFERFQLGAKLRIADMAEVLAAQKAELEARAKKVPTRNTKAGRK